MKPKNVKSNVRRCVILAAVPLTIAGTIQKMQAAENGPVALSTQQSNVTIKGTVTNANGEPLIGVSVIEKGTTNGIVTDIDGNYQLAVSKGSTIEFSYVGFAKQEIKVGSENVINVVLQEDNQLLNEVVVVGYGSMKRSDIATAISSVKPEDMNLAGANSRDVRQLLDGKVAGLSITRTNGSNPNNGVAVQMRGVVSVNGDQSPLVVIDGIPGGNIDLLRSEDIESIDVLKDGSAAAIYGSRANAGVILITTKRGQAGRTSVDYSTYLTHYWGIERPDFMSASEYRARRAELGDPSYMPDNGGSTDWFDELLNSGNVSHSHNLSISGGTESTVYRASLYYSNLEGVAKATDREQYGGRMSLETKALNDMLTFQTNVSLNYGNMNLLGGDGEWESALRANPTNPIYNADGSYFEDYAKDENKVARLDQQQYDRQQTTSSFDGKLTFEPIEGLKGSVFVSYTRDDQKDRRYYDLDSRISYNSYNSGGYAWRKSYMNTQRTLEPTIEYAHTFADDHKLNAIVGYSYQYEVYEQFEANNNGFLNDATEDNNLGSGSGLNGDAAIRAGMGSEKKDETLIAFFGRINYVYKDRYVAQFSLRHEGSSKFGDNNKWGNFPSASVAWNVSNEEFMKDQNVLSNLKLRVGYGVTGNSGIDPYQSMVTLSGGNQYLNPNGQWLQTWGPSRNPNEDLRWEKKKEWNFGVDFGVLENRITGALDVYKRTADDLLMTGVTVPSPANIHSTSTLNIGSISSSGLELTLNAVPIVKKDFQWRTTVTMSKVFSNKLNEFSYSTADYLEFGSIGGYGAMGNAVRLYAGDEIGNFYGKKFAGFDEDGEWLFYNKEGEAVHASEMDDSDRQVIGNGQPKWYLSWTNNFTYKNFDLSFMFKGRFGYDILNRLNMFYTNYTTLQAGYNVLNSTFEDGVNASYQYSDYYLEKGNYIRLDNITLGYNFRNKNPKWPSFRVYVSATDLFTITGYDGLNPEMDDTGMSPSMESCGRTPVTRSVSVGLNVKF